MWICQKSEDIGANRKGSQWPKPVQFKQKKKKKKSTTIKLIFDYNIKYISIKT